MQAASSRLDPQLFGTRVMSPALGIHLGRQHLHWLGQYSSALQHWGWRWTRHVTAEGRVEVQQVPVILGKQIQAAGLQVRV